MKTLFPALFALLSLIVFSCGDISQEESEPNEDINYQTHVIAKGESLYEVAQKYGTSIDELRNINPELGQAENWKVGVAIQVPNHQIKTVPSDGSVHIVQKGESLYSVSQKYDLEVEELKQLNPALEDENTWKEGLEIRLKR